MNPTMSELVKQDINPDDYISKLPSDVVLHILSLIPLYDAMSMFLLSRRWRNLLGSLRVWDFDTQFRLSNSLVNKTLTVHKPSVDLQRFRVNYNWINQKIMDLRIEDPNDIDCLMKSSRVVKYDPEWISEAMLHNVKELDLTLRISSPETLYELPSFVFSSQTLTSLKLAYCNIKDIPLMNLISLKYLCLESVIVGSETLNNMLASCLLLETLCLYNCVEFNSLFHELNSLEGPRLSNLAHLEIISCPILRDFKIVVPILQSFTSVDGELPMMIKYVGTLNMHDFTMEFSRLVSLSLAKSQLRDDMVPLLMEKCPLLENFRLHSCKELKQLRIFSHNLKRLGLISCDGINKIEIDAPNLRHFDYMGSPVVEVPLMNSDIMLVAELQFLDKQSYEKEIHAEKLKKFLERFNHVKTVRLVTAEELDLMLILQNSLPPLYHLKDLKFETNSTKKSYLQILDSLLRLSVHLEVLTIYIGSCVIKLKFRPAISRHLDDFPNLDWSFLPQDHLQRLMEFEIKNQYTEDNRKEDELVDFLCTNAAITGVSYNPCLKNWTSKASQRKRPYSASYNLCPL